MPRGLPSSISSTVSSAMFRALVVPLLVVTTAVGCAGEEEPAPTTLTSSAPSAPSPAKTPSPSESGEPAEPDEASATGEEVALDGVSLRLPVGYVVVDSSEQRLNARGDARLGNDEVNVLSVDNLGITSTTDDAARQYLRTAGYLREPEFLDPVDVDGVELWHLEGPVNDVQAVQVYGTDAGDRTLSIELKLDRDTPVEEQRRVAASVLATLDLDA